MKRITLLIIVALFLAFNANAKWYITTDQVFIRSGAGKSYRQLGTVSSGAYLDVSEIKGSWAKIRYQNKDCFISAKFLKESAPPPTNTQTTSNIFSNLISAIGGLFAIFFLLYVLYRVLLGVLSFLGLRSNRYKSGNYRSGGGKSTGGIPTPPKPQQYDQNAVNAATKSNAKLASGDRPLLGPEYPYSDSWLLKPTVSITICLILLFFLSQLID